MSLAARQLNQYHVFLASPGDVAAERQHVRQFFDDYNRPVFEKAFLRWFETRDQHPIGNDGRVLFLMRAKEAPWLASPCPDTCGIPDRRRP